MEIDWQEWTGYCVGCFSWVHGMVPGTCEGWSQLFTLLIVSVTFLFITLPKAWDFQKKRWGKKGR